MRTSTLPQVGPSASVYLVLLGSWLGFCVFSVVEKYMKKLFGTSKDQMGVDQKAVLLVSKVNESKRHGELWTGYPCPLHCVQAGKLLFCCSSSLHNLQRPEEMEAKIIGPE